MWKWISVVTALFLTTVSIFLFAYAKSGLASDKEILRIIGKWDSRIRSDNGGVTLEFLPDGTFKKNSDFERAGRYEFKENRLTTHVWDDKDKREKQRIFDVTLNGDQITMKEANSTLEISMERVCKSGSSRNDFLGEWFSQNYPGAIHVFPMVTPPRFPAFVEFTKDKKVFFRSVPVKSTPG